MKKKSIFTVIFTMICSFFLLVGCTNHTETSDKIPEDTNGKVLVAYFSATNTTKSVAEKIAASTGGTLYSITPVQPYTSADLNYSDRNSRATKEQNDSTVRPEISGEVENFDEYDIVFLGYPIWWAEAPKIIYSFLESYDFEGKTIIPFCTSGGSGVGNSAKNLHSSASKATWLEGTKLSGSASQSSIDAYVAELGFRKK
ncbi:MAG: flavodoxin [Anaeroplasmataceae bacterium]|nr:flavodoxin [Anaeroplasmataceae bacterium]